MAGFCVGNSRLHGFTVADFTTLCDLLDIEILEWMGFDDRHQPLPPDADLNFLATLAIARLARR